MATALAPTSPLPDSTWSPRGFNDEFGINVFRWAAMGFDFSVMDGHTALTPLQLNPAVEAQLAPLLGTLHNVRVTIGPTFRFGKNVEK